MDAEERRYLTAHRSHDYGTLMRRWSRVARSAGLRAEVIHVAGGYDVLSYGSGDSVEGGDAVYLCAGVHGDEPAGVLGLLEWAEENARLLSARDVLILPCFNPWGLVNNSRVDHRERI